MTRPLYLLLFLISSFLPGCILREQQSFVVGTGYVLATREATGGKENYELVFGAAIGDASLRCSTERQRTRPFLGFQVVELDKAAADARKLKPYSGLLVRGAYSGSAAELGGARPGDVLLSIGGRPMAYLSSLAEFESGLADGEAVTAKVLRAGDELDLTMKARVLSERVSDVQEVPLEAPATIHPYAGVGLRGIPAVWAERIFGAPRQAVVVTTVDVGSPAWVAGFRAGDVLETVDGEPVPDVHTLCKQIAAAGEQGQEMRWRVRRGPGEEHEGVVALADYTAESLFWFPFVCFVKAGAAEDRWSVGPLGLLLANRNTYVADSRTRQVKTRNEFSALLWLVQVSSGAESTEVRLLWFITFRS